MTLFLIPEQERVILAQKMNQMYHQTYEDWRRSLIQMVLFIEPAPKEEKKSRPHDHLIQRHIRSPLHRSRRS